MESKRSALYWAAWFPETVAIHNNSQAYNPCREGHPPDRALTKDQFGFTYEICTRCGRSVGLTIAQKIGQDLPHDDNHHD